MADKAKPKAGRTRRVVRNISVEPDDASVLKWIGEQKKLSESLRDLIIDEIERNGYTDRHFREVVQVPQQAVFPGIVPFAAGQPAAQEAAVADTPVPAAEEAPASSASSALPAVVAVASAAEAAAPEAEDHVVDDDSARTVAAPDMLDGLMNSEE